MKKTPLKQLIDEMQELKKTKIFNNSLKAIDECIDLAYAKLEIEKEEIKKAVIFGNRQDPCQALQLQQTGVKCRF